MLSILNRVSSRLSYLLIISLLSLTTSQASDLEPRFLGSLINAVQGGASFCVSLGSSYQFQSSVAQNAVGAGLTLDEGVCICADINTAPLGLQVVTSAGANFTAALAADIKKSLVKDLLGLGALARFNFDIDDLCIQLSLGIANSHHDFQPGPGGCCVRCYEKNANGACVPICPPANKCKNQCYDKPQIQCNNQCYDASQYTCPSGVPVAKNGLRRRDRDGHWCSLGLTKCPVPGAGSRAAGWECVDVKRDIESCGGCMYPHSPLTLSSSSISGSGIPTGQDCTAIPNINEVKCHLGHCQIQSCLRGFQPNQNGTSCESKTGIGAGVAGFASQKIVSGVEFVMAIDGLSEI